MNDAARPGWQDYAVRLWVILSACLCAASVVAHMQIGLNNDNMDLLDQVQRWLDGGKPYVAYADINPPLIHMLYVLPVLMSRLLPPMSLATALYLFTFALTALALVVTSAILKYSGVRREASRLLLGALALALLALSFIHQTFADREHLTLVLGAPWLVLYSPLVQRQPVPVRWRLAAALMAAVGFALKPYFYVFYGAAVVFTAGFDRPWREVAREWEHYVIIGFALVYLAIIELFFREYVTHILPLAMHTYGAISWDWMSKFHVVEYDLLGHFGVTAFGATVALLVLKPRFDRLVAYLYFLLLAAVASYLLNGGWYYTQYPFIAMAFMLAVALAAKLAEACDALPPGNGRRLWMAGLGLLMAAGLTYYFAEPVVWRAGWDMKLQRQRGHPLATLEIPGPAWQRLNRHLDVHPRFMFFTLMERSVDLLQEGGPRRNVSRYDYLWPLPGLVHMEQQPYRQDHYQALYAYFMRGMADDLQQQKPDMVISDVSPYQLGMPGPFNMVDWLNKDPSFAKAWQNYKLADKIDACTPKLRGICAFDVYYHK